MGFFHCEPGTAGCETIFFTTIIKVGSDSIRAGLQACSVNRRGGIAPRNFHPGAIPFVFDRTFRIEIRSAGSRGHRLAGKDFGLLCRASRAGWHWRRIAAEAKHESRRESHVVPLPARSRGRGRIFELCPEVVGLNKSDGEPVV